MAAANLIKLSSSGEYEALGRERVLRDGGDAALPGLAPRLFAPLLGQVALLLPAPALPLLVDVVGGVGVGFRVALDDGRFAVVLRRRFLQKKKKLWWLLP